MVADAVEDAWMETAFLAIAAFSGSDVQFASLTETMDFDLGEKDIEDAVLVNGGRVTKWVAEGQSSVTLEAYPLEAGTVSGTGGKGFFDLLHVADASQPIRISNSRSRTKYRLLALWTNDSAVVTAQSSTASNKSALRIGLADGYVTSVKPSFTDGTLKFTITYKTSPFQKDGTSNVMMESVDGTSTLPAIAAYSTASTPFA